KEYELSQIDSTWIAYQYGRAYLGLDMYPEAEKVFRALAFWEDAEPHYVVYLARTLQQHGALEEAIQILRRGARRHKNNYAILTSLGVDLERARADDEALSILFADFRAISLQYSSGVRHHQNSFEARTDS